MTAAIGRFFDMYYTQAATEAAPWWGVPFVAGLFAILGVVASQILTTAHDRRRAKREDQQRWHADRRTAYAAFLAAVEVCAVEIRRPAGKGSVALGGEDAYMIAMQRYQEVNLLASEAVRALAGTLWLTMLSFFNRSRASTKVAVSSTDDDIFRAVSETHRLFEERDRLVAAMRQEIDIAA